MKIFQSNLEELKELKENQLGDDTVEFGITKFYDFTDDEFKKMFTFNPKYLKDSEYEPKSKIYQPEAFVSSQLFYLDSEWLPDFIDKLLNDKNFDFFK